MSHLVWNTRHFPRSLPLLLAVIVLFLGTPYWGSSVFARTFLGAFIVLAIGFGGSLMANVKTWWRWYGLFIGLSLLPIAYRPFGPQPVWLEYAELGLTSVIIILTLFVVHRFVLFNVTEDPLDRILGAICGYLLLALLWVQFHEIVRFSEPHAMVDNITGEFPDRPALVYHSLVTLTTLGYGDVVPVHPTSRILAGLEAATGTIYLAVIIASLVSQSRREPSRD